MSDNTGLHPVTSKLVRDEWERLRREKIEPWLFLEFGEGLHVVDFYGRSIRYRGVRFPGSPKIVFWSKYIDPFLEDIALRLLDRTVALCKEEGHAMRPALVETGHLLKGLFRTAFSEMVRVDERLVGDANPGNVPTRSPDDAIGELDAFVDARVRGLVGVLQPSRTTLQRWRGRLEQNKIAASIVIIATFIAALGAFTDTVSRLITPVMRWLHR